MAKAAKKAPSTTDDTKKTERKGTVHRVVDILAALAAVKTDIGVAELAKQVNLPFPTVHRLLHLLREEDVVTWHETSHRYSIGPELLRISRQVQSSFDDVIKQGEKYLNEIRDTTGETVLFGLYGANSLNMSFVSVAMGSHPLQYRFQMNQPLTLVYGASGKVILAFMPPEKVVAAYEAESEMQASGLPKPGLDVLQDDLLRIRANGYAATEGEKLLGARGISAPIFDASGIFGSFCITCPRERIPLDRVAEFADIVKRCAAEFSHVLGGQQP